MNTQQPVKKRRSSLYILWLIPLIALGVALTTLYQHFENRGMDVVVVLDSAEGFKVDTTPLKYKGIEVGKITHIEVNDEDIDKIDVTININNDVADIIAREGTSFWIVEPNISLSGVSGLGTLLSGNYIACMTEGKTIEEIESQEVKTEFKVLKQPPLDASNLGKLVNLHSDYGELSLGSPVLYHDFVVGSVVDQSLVGKKIVYKVSIDKKYASLLKEKSRFWKKSALDIKASLKGVELKMASLDSLISGGVEFTSPEEGFEAESGSDFKLYDDEKDTTMSDKPIILYADSGHNLEEGTSVYFNGVEAGKVKSVEHDRKNKKAIITISLYNIYKDEVNKSSYFWVVEPTLGLGGLENLEAFFEGSYISFVTNEMGLEYADSFDLHVKAPEPNGYKIRLKPNGTTSIKEGSGIYYNAHKVGEIFSVEFLDRSGERVIEGVIYDKYKSLINNSSLFYISSGVIFEASLDGVYLQSGSLDDMIRGGIAFITPKNKRLDKKDFTLFSDYKSFKDARYLSQNGEYFTLVAKSAKDISKKMPLFYKDFKAGEVVDFEYSPKKDSVEVRVFIEERFAQNIDSNTRFFSKSGLKVEAGLDGVKVEASPLQSLLVGGIGFENYKGGAKVKKDHIFTLYDEKELKKDGVLVELYMDRKFGVREGSALMYRGVNVGAVESLSLDDKRVKVVAKLQKEFEDFLRYDTVFYVDEFELGLGGLKNSESLLAGSAISIIPGSSKVKNSVFEVSKKTPSPTLYEKGLRVLLKASRKSSLDIGSPLYYRQVKIGEIEDLRLSGDYKSVEFMVFIDECYADIVRENSRFYQAGGVGFDIDLFGVKVETETVETLLTGGIVLATPTEFGEPIKTKTVFKLFDNPKDEWLKWEPAISRLKPECQTLSP